MLSKSEILNLMTLNAVWVWCLGLLVFSLCNHASLIS